MILAALPLSLAAVLAVSLEAGDFNIHGGGGSFLLITLASVVICGIAEAVLVCISISRLKNSLTLRTSNNISSVAIGILFLGAVLAYVVFVVVKQ